MAEHILFVGLGSIGMRHLGNIVTLFRSGAIQGEMPKFFVLRKQPRPQVEFVQGVVITNVNSYDEAFTHNPRIAFICNPTIFHLEAAVQAARHNCHLFIEKPLAATLEGAGELVSLAAQHKLVVMIGCVLRFKAAMRKLKELLDKKAVGSVYHFSIDIGQYLPEWTPGRDYRESYRAKEELGGGAVLELIHEIDYARYLFGEYAVIKAITGHQSSLDITAEDTAKIICKMKNGMLGSISMDFLQRIPNRTLKIVGETGTILADLNTNTIFIERPGKSAEVIKAEEDKNAMYLAELLHFFECVASGKTPDVSLKDGILSLQAALQAKEQQEEEKQRASQRAGLPLGDTS